MLDNISARSFSLPPLPISGEASSASGSSDLRPQRSNTLGGIAHPLQAAEQGRMELPEQAPLAHRASDDQNVAHHALQQLPGTPARESTAEHQFSVPHPKVRDGTVLINNLALPPGLNAEELKDAKIEVGAKIARGSALVDHILSGHPPNTPCTQKDVSDIMWALHTQAESKAGMNWHEGAVCIEDPNGRLREFLDSNNEAYQRASTHVSGFQTLEQGKPRGIDFNSEGSGRDLKNVLPNSRGTLLYQAMGVQDGAKVCGMPKNMLLLKMEPYGAYSGSMNKKEHAASGPTRESNRHDRGHFLGHIGTTIQSICRRIMGNNSPVGSCKERIPSGMQKGYAKLASWHLIGSVLPKNIRNILNSDHPTSSAGGIRIMHRNINEAIKMLQADPSSKPKDIEALKNFLATHIENNPRLMDNINCRIGEEIILSSAELSDHPEAPTGNYAQAIAEKETRNAQAAAERELKNIQAIVEKEIKNASNLDDAVKAYNKAPSLENAMTIMSNYCHDKKNSVYVDFKAIALDRSLRENGLSNVSIADGVVAKYTPEKLKDLFNPLAHLQKLHLPENSGHCKTMSDIATKGRFGENIDFLHDAAPYQQKNINKEEFASIYNTYIKQGSERQLNLDDKLPKLIKNQLDNFENTNPDDIKISLASAMNAVELDTKNNVRNVIRFPEILTGLPS